MGARLAWLVSLASLLAGCRGLPINVQTPKPLQVDVTLRVDIHQHRSGATGDTETAAPTADAGTSDEEVRRRARMSEVQTAKNSRILGENRYGLLSVIRLPPGQYGQRIEQLVAEENADRSTLMRAEAASRRVPLATVEAEQAAQWRARAFPGEWIEEQQTDKTWRWTRKQASGTSTPPVLEPPASPPR